MNEGRKYMWMIIGIDFVSCRLVLDIITNVRQCQTIFIRDDYLY